ncbi:MAG: HEPN domain-containing protein, partial [Methylocystis sp.]
LNRYTKLFDIGINKKFKFNLSRRKASIDKRIGRNIESSYEQILSWRHDFAHAGLRNTTIEEALITHRLAKRVLYAFDEAFSS